MTQFISITRIMWPDVSSETSRGHRCGLRWGGGQGMAGVWRTCSCSLPVLEVSPRRPDDGVLLGRPRVIISCHPVCNGLFGSHGPVIPTASRTV